MRRRHDPKRGTDDLFVSIPVLFSDDALGNEHATGEHTGQKTGQAADPEDVLKRLSVQPVAPRL
ncbi:MAG: hypothetical protein KY432_04865 [Acidobacteria bacterium]|nr:hypothetical protein [Acidobacteriota bacterium]